MPPAERRLDRLQGFMRAIRSAKIRPDRSMIHTGHNDMESGHFHAMQLLTRAQRPTAIFCTNNMMALGALAAIQEIDLGCPEEISLLGFDDFYWATLLRPRTDGGAPARQRNGNDCGETVDRSYRRAGERSHASAARNTTNRSRLLLPPQKNLVAVRKPQERSPTKTRTSVSWRICALNRNREAALFFAQR